MKITFEYDNSQHNHRRGIIRVRERGMKKEIIVNIDEHWQRECLESIFGDEDISNINHDYNEDGTETEYEMECVLRRKINE